MSQSDMSRRNFVKGAGATAAAVGMTAFAGAAFADEAAEAAGSYTYADTVEWAAEYDVVVLGMGFAGMVAAMEAADAGATVLLCDKCPDGMAGGNSRVCGQGFAYGSDDYDATFAYYSEMTGGREVPEAVLSTIVDGVAHMATTMSDKFGMNRDEFILSSDSSPEYPEFSGSDKVGFWLTHQGSSDSYLYKSMRARLTDGYADKIDVWFETPGTALIQEPTAGTIIGVTVDRKGETRNVRALNGVCVCTGGFENDKEMMQHYLNLVDCTVVGGLYNTGDGIKMCMDAGCRLWHMAMYEGIRNPLALGYDIPDGFNARPVGFPFSGSIMVVGTKGKRFGDESYPTRHGHVPDGNGIWENPRYPVKVFAVWDQTQMDELDAAGTINEVYRDTIASYPDVASAAEGMGCAAEDLQATIDDFNSYAENGRDHAFGRTPESMRAFDGTAYYVMPMRSMILNTQGGPERNENAEVLDVNGNPIPHLYSAGEMGGFTASMYQAGTNVAECFIFGQLAGANAAAAKDPLPPFDVTSPVESTPAHLGDETDLGAASAAVRALKDSAAEGELVGVGNGVGGDFAVTVTLDDAGAIASVTVGDNFETPRIGTPAIEQLPEKLIGLSTAEEIDAVDAVSGATLTSNAIKEAVKDALGL